MRVVAVGPVVRRAPLGVAAHLRAAVVPPAPAAPAAGGNDALDHLGLRVDDDGSRDAAVAEEASPARRARPLGFCGACAFFFFFFLRASNDGWIDAPVV